MLVMVVTPGKSGQEALFQPICSWIIQYLTESACSCQRKYKPCPRQPPNLCCWMATPGNAGQQAFGYWMRWDQPHIAGDFSHPALQYQSQMKAVNHKQTASIVEARIDSAGQSLSGTSREEQTQGMMKLWKPQLCLQKPGRGLKIDRYMRIAFLSGIRDAWNTTFVSAGLFQHYQCIPDVMERFCRSGSGRKSPAGGEPLPEVQEYVPGFRGERRVWVGFGKPAFSDIGPEFSGRPGSVQDRLDRFCQRRADACACPAQSWRKTRA